MYKFNRAEITSHPLHQIEYSIIDICNKNCKACSHFAPLAIEPNLVGIEEFIENAKILHKLIPDVHTFWLIGGEPTLHPQYLLLLKELRSIYSDIPIGIMTNGYRLLEAETDKNFWRFIREHEIIWHITTYDVAPKRYIELFERNGCRDLLSLDINNKFYNLVTLTEEKQEISQKKYNKCGWERLNIFVRNGRIWKCPTVEYIDLFNNYFEKQFEISIDDYLKIDDSLTRERLLMFQNIPSYFCANCDISKRYTSKYDVVKSKKDIKEWLSDR